MELESALSEAARLAREEEQSKTYSDADLLSTELPFSLVSAGRFGTVRPVPAAHSRTGLDTLPAGAVPTVDSRLTAVPSRYLPTASEYTKKYIEFDPANPPGQNSGDNLYDWNEQWSDAYYRLEPCDPRTTLSLLPRSIYGLGALDDETRDASACPESQEGLAFQEKFMDNAGKTATNSASITRAPGPLGEFVRGSVNNVPFRPGGLDSDSDEDDDADGGAYEQSPRATHHELFPWEHQHQHDCTAQLRALLPGFEKGLKAPSASPSPVSSPSASSRVEVVGEVPYSMGSNDHSLLQSYANADDHQMDSYRQDIINEREERKRQQTASRPPAKATSFADIFGEDGDSDSDEDLIPTSSHTSPSPSTRPSQPLQTTEPDTPSPSLPPVNREDAMLERLLEATPGGEDTLRLESVLVEAEETKRKRQEGVWAMEEKLDGCVDFYDKVPEMAIQYPFELDSFQKQAIVHLEQNESVFVAAHTSAGKTVVAEYAIALACKHLTRAIYTSPIKTLSNQKFREFKRTFGDVGIVTGDVSVNPEASCLILTTEILRSMLYKGADLIRDVEWVIFDEVHYINDVDRGVVWEEVIIMLPAHVNLILLSATVPNTMEFANWVGRTKRKVIHVISTLRRPVPLQHNVWANGELYTVVDSKGSFLRSGVTQAKAALNKTPTQPSQRQAQAQGRGRGRGGAQAQAERGGRGRGRGGRGASRAAAQAKANKYQSKKLASYKGSGGGGRRGGGQKMSWVALVHYLKKREMLPVVVFAFSKRICESASSSMQSLDLTTQAEKSQVHLTFNAAVTRLHGSDRELPQILHVRDLLKRGIGVHHSGLLPIVKEVVEMVFAQGLVKILFATETFAMGVNMPTRTVFFESLRKHDGRDFRSLLPGEYTQMAGRAGRRGLDEFGCVIVNSRNGEVPDESDLKHLILGKPTRLQSQFRLTYNMILNLLRVEDMRVEDMIKRSFSEFHTQRMASTHKGLLKKGQARLQAIGDIECLYEQPSLITTYHQLHSQVAEVNRLLVATLLNTPQGDKFLSPGRVVAVTREGHVKKALCCLLEVRRSGSGHSYISESARRKRLVGLVLVPSEWGLSHTKLANLQRQHGADSDSPFMHGEVRGQHGVHWWVREVRPSDVSDVCKARLRVNAADIVLDGRQSAVDAVVSQLSELRVEAQEQGQDIPTALHPVKDMRIQDMDFVQMFEQKAGLEEMLQGSQCHACPKLHEHLAHAEKQSRLRRGLDQLRYNLSDENIELMGEFDKMVNVLRELQYVDRRKTVELKGRVACEINTCDSLILTELIYENALTNLSCEEVVSLLSCLVFQQKTDVQPTPDQLTERLMDAHGQLSAVTHSLAVVQLKHKVDLSPDEYVRENLKPGLMHVVLEWARGRPFKEICALTDVQEGTIVRTIVRLDETCKDVRNAARVIGDPELFTKMERSSALIKRDIVFAASLYIS